MERHSMHPLPFALESPHAPFVGLLHHGSQDLPDPSTWTLAMLRADPLAKMTVNNASGVVGAFFWSHHTVRTRTPPLDEPPGASPCARLVAGADWRRGHPTTHWLRPSYMLTHTHPGIPTPTPFQFTHEYFDNATYYDALKQMDLNLAMAVRF